VNPFRYAADLEPVTAARLAGRPFVAERALAAAADLSAEVDFLLVEGCGGPAAPLAPGLRQLDLAARLDLPVLLVLASRPGALNLGLLALESLTARRCPMAGVVLSRLEPPLRPEEAELPLLIEQFAGDVVRGVLPHFSAAELADSEHLARRFAVHLDLERILQPPAWQPKHISQ
jgi:dethiobiotin synthetase